jgi:hypothetical protein
MAEGLEAEPASVLAARSVLTECASFWRRTGGVRDRCQATFNRYFIGDFLPTARGVSPGLEGEQSLRVRHARPFGQSIYTSTISACGDSGCLREALAHSLSTRGESSYWRITVRRQTSSRKP